MRWFAATLNKAAQQFLSYSVDLLQQVGSEFRIERFQGLVFLQRRSFIVHGAVRHGPSEKEYIVITILAPIAATRSIVGALISDRKFCEGEPLS